LILRDFVKFGPENLIGYRLDDSGTLFGIVGQVAVPVLIRVSEVDSKTQHWY
jgi:hypothetical protein